MSNGKLYLVAVSKLKQLPEDVKIKLLITRKKLDINGITYFPELAPSKKLFFKYLNEWKSGKVPNWWDLYKQEFISQLVTPAMTKAVERVYTAITNGNDVAIICFCTNKQCHRYIIGELFEAFGIEVVEITNKTEMSNKKLFS